MSIDVPIPDGLRLATPRWELLAAYLEMTDIAFAAGETGDGYTLIDPLATRRNPEAFLARATDLERGRNLPPGYVAMGTRWLLDAAGKLVGETRIRHALNADLEVEGGHIGYFIHTHHRGKGYGNAILALGLIELRRLGIDRVLVTCNADNDGSQCIIKRNGGVFRRFTTSPRSGKQVMTFWIENGSTPMHP